MKARLVVFPIKGRNWCFIRSIDRSNSQSESSQSPSTFKHLWQTISSNSQKSFTAANVELCIDFVANKLGLVWRKRLLEVSRTKSMGIIISRQVCGNVYDFTLKLGLKLLSRVKPSEIFLKSIPKQLTGVEVVFPSSFNARLVRRRLRHIAMRGTIIHKNYFYGSVSLLPVTSAFAVLPLPNVPFFWILFRTYSHWRAFKGSEKLLELVSDSSKNLNSPKNKDDSEKETDGDSLDSPLIMEASEDLERLIGSENGVSNCRLKDICKVFDLNTMDVLKYQQHQN